MRGASRIGNTPRSSLMPEDTGIAITKHGSENHTGLELGNGLIQARL